MDAHELGATVIVATHALEFTEVAKRCIGLRDGELGPVFLRAGGSHLACYCNRFHEARQGIGFPAQL